MLDIHHQGHREMKLVVSFIASLISGGIAFSCMTGTHSQTGTSFFWALVFFAMQGRTFFQLFLFALDQHKMHGSPLKF